MLNYIFDEFLGMPPHGSIRLTVAETETDNKYTELNGNLCCYLSLQCVHLHTILYNPFFIGLGLGHCQSDRAINERSDLTGHYGVCGLVRLFVCLWSLTNTSLLPAPPAQKWDNTRFGFT